MDLRETAARSSRKHAGTASLRFRWRTASLASGWPFPDDWALPEIEQVCQAVLSGADPSGALAGLGAARAREGSGLDETLQDVAALHAVTSDHHDGLVVADPDVVPAALLRTAALGWASVAVDRLARIEVVDGLTGLTTSAYLRTRLAELYREATVQGVAAEYRHVLVAVSLDARPGPAWSRLAAQVLIADVLRAVFDGGETLATVGPSVSVVLARRDERLPMRTASARWLAAERLHADPELRPFSVPRVWLERLPASHDAACTLLTRLART